MWYLWANSSCVRDRARRSVLVRGRRLAVRRCSGVMGRASGSACAAATISASVISRIGVGGNGRSRPSFSTSTTVPSDRIFAAIIFSLIFFRPPGRDDSKAISALSIGHMEQPITAHPDQIDAFLAIDLPVVDHLKSKRISQCDHGVMERDSMISEVHR